MEKFTIVSAPRFAAIESYDWLHRVQIHIISFWPHSCSIDNEWSFLTIEHCKLPNPGIWISKKNKTFINNNNLRNITSVFNSNRVSDKGPSKATIQKNKRQMCWSSVIKCFEESKSKVLDERLVLLLCLGGIWVE